jgi:hypothetical protein
MQTIIVCHKVGDINAWLEGHQDRVELLAPVTSGFRTFQDTSDPNSVVLVMETDDLEAFIKTVTDPALDEVKAKHTVLAPITISTEVIF